MKWCVFLLFFAISCMSRTSSSDAQKMRVGMDVEPVSLDPRCARDVGGVHVLQMLFGGLTRVSVEGMPELMVAREVEVAENGLRYTFHLKPTLWSDGTPVTSADFAF